MSSESIANNRAKNRQFEQVNNGTGLHVVEQLLQQYEMTSEQRLTILEAIHRILPTKIRILQDTAHNKWICIHYIPNTKKTLRKVRIYHPRQGFEYLKFHEIDKKIIDEWYRESNWKAREGLTFLPYSEPNCHQDVFLFVLALALYVATEQPLSNLQARLGNGTENIRAVIMEMLRNGSLPLEDEANSQAENQQVEKGGIDSVLEKELPKNAASKSATEPLLRPDDLTDAQKVRIVEVMHRILPEEIRILEDNGHESWICVEKATVEGEDRIFVYSPSREFESNRFKDEDQQNIDKWYGESDWRPREFTVFQPCLKAKPPQDEFIFVLAYALCRAMHQPVSGFENALDGENTQYVCNEIVRLIRLPSLPLDVSAENWKRAKNH